MKKLDELIEICGRKKGYIIEAKHYEGLTCDIELGWLRDALVEIKEAVEELQRRPARVVYSNHEDNQ